FSQGVARAGMSEAFGLAPGIGDGLSPIANLPIANRQSPIERRNSAEASAKHNSKLDSPARIVNLPGHARSDRPRAGAIQKESVSAPAGQFNRALDRGDRSFVFEQQTGLGRCFP